MYHSAFYEMLYHINAEKRWRGILGWSEPDLHMKDLEILLRGFAMLIEGADYAPSMAKFLNQFSRKCATNTNEENTYLQNLFMSFLDACLDLPDDAFINKRNKRFNVAFYEAVFAAACRTAVGERRLLEGTFTAQQLSDLEVDGDFIVAGLEGTTRTANVETRLNRARVIVGAL